ncbi:MAG: peptidylprolyl isomerase [Rhodanobacteraceae bacterium]
MYRNLLSALLLTFAPLTALAATPSTAATTPSTVVVSQGEVSLTLNDIDSYARTLPQDKVGAVFASPKRIEAILRNLLLTRQLAQEAKQSGLDSRSEVKAAVSLATEKALSSAQTEAMKRRAENTMPDLSELARERYMAKPEQFRIPAKVEARHILIATKDRSDADARALADKLHAQLLKDPGQFAAYVEKYSDDSSKKNNGGLIKDATSDQLVEPFRKAAAKLTRPGEISDPVRTKYGYHILKAIKITPARQRSFAEVKDQLVSQLQHDWVAKKVQNQIDDLRSEKIDANAALVASLRTRYQNSADSAGKKSKEKP